jgi:hypothetical protein
MAVALLTAVAVGLLVGWHIHSPVVRSAPGSADGFDYYCSHHYCPSPLHDSETAVAEPDVAPLDTSPSGAPAGQSCIYRPSIRAKAPPPCTDLFNAANSSMNELVPPGYRVLRAAPPWPMIVTDDNTQ